MDVVLATLLGNKRLPSVFAHHAFESVLKDEQMVTLHNMLDTPPH